MPPLAGVSAGAEVHVVAGCAIRFRRVGAGAGRTVTLAEVVALIEGRADHRVPPGALPGLTRVRSGAEAQVVAGGAVLFRRVGADPRGRVTLPHLVALVEGSTGDRVRPDALACQAPVGLGTRIAIVARRTLVLGEVDAGASPVAGLPCAGGLGAAALSPRGKSAVDAARVARLVTLLTERGLDDAVAAAGSRQRDARAEKDAPDPAAETDGQREQRDHAARQTTLRSTAQQRNRKAPAGRNAPQPGDPGVRPQTPAPRSTSHPPLPLRQHAPPCRTRDRKLRPKGTYTRSAVPVKQSNVMSLASWLAVAVPPASRAPRQVPGGSAGPFEAATRPVRQSLAGWSTIVRPVNSSRDPPASPPAPLAGGTAPPARALPHPPARVAPRPRAAERC